MSNELTREAGIRTRLRIPIRHGRYKADLFSFSGLIDGHEHIALGLGAWSSVEIPLVRLHSECLTGDVFGSQKCDCGKQLDEALERISEAGGVLLYLRQEGRGIGLYNKLDAYYLQSKGKNTFEANRALGFKDDPRQYAVAAQMLRALGLTRIRLLSNNPEKQRQLLDSGIEVVERVNTGIFHNIHNENYLAAKVIHGGHEIDLTQIDLSGIDLSFEDREWGICKE